jgi:acyl-CoA synthetase (AMP-forming)/AMP-acid ligase II
MGRNDELRNGIQDSVQTDLEPVSAHVVAQFHNSHGGSSFYVHGGERATEGYSVGGLHGVPATVVDSPTITPAQFQEHRDKVRKAVKDRDAVAGTWVEDGKTVMDASNVVTDRDRAKRLQVSRGEKAVYNLSEGREEDLR